MEVDKPKHKNSLIILYKNQEGRPLLIKFPFTPNTVAKNFLYSIEQKLRKKLEVSDYIFTTLLDAINFVYSLKKDKDGEYEYYNGNEEDLYPTLMQEWRAAIQWLSEPLPDNSSDYTFELRRVHENDRVSS